MVRRKENLCLTVSRSTLSTPPSTPPPELKTTELVTTQKPKLKKQTSPKQSPKKCEAPRDAAWEKRRRQMMLIQEKKQNHDGDMISDCVNLTDEDLRELKGSIELGFGFNEEAAGQRLCNTLPALDLYFAVNRQMSPIASPSSGGGSSLSSSSAVSSGGPPCSPRNDLDSLKIVSPGDSPQQVKTRLRHWAQAVACSVMQSS